MMSTIGTGVAGQLAVLVSGVAAARALGVQDRGHQALIALIAPMVVMLGTGGVPLAVTYYLAQGRGGVRPVLRSLRPLIAGQLVVLLPLHLLLLWALSDHASAVLGPALLFGSYAGSD